MDKVGIRTIVVNFEDEQLPYLSLVQGDAKTRGFDIVICDSDGKEIAPSDDYIVELVATGSNAPDTPYSNRHTIEDGKYRVMIPTEALSMSGFVVLQLVFYQKSTGAVIHTIEQKCPVYRSRGQEVVESNNLYVDITALRLGIERIDELDSRYENMLGEEKIRQDAEDKRNLDEAIRKDNESIRKANEVKRESNESTRQSQESERVTAEEEREIKFDSWDKTMEGIIPNATNTIAGVVKVDKMPTETGEITVPSVGKLEEVSAQLAQTMTQTEFDSWVATLLDGGPSIFFETLTALRNTYPNGAEGVALVRETDPSRIYVWNGTDWQDFGEYQGIVVKNETITKQKLSLDLQEFINDWQAVLTEENESWVV